MTDLQKKLIQAFPELEFKHDFVLAPLTYFKIGGPAEIYLELSDEEEIVKLVSFCFKEKVKVTILGGASNVIVSDEGISGLVLNLSNRDVSHQQQDDGSLVRAGSGIKTALLVRETLDLKLTGLEYFLGVPGKLGGAVYNNAHYLQSLISDHISRVEIINKSGNREWLDRDQCDFAYDKSRFQTTHEVILNVEFSLKNGSKEESAQLIAKATRYRAETQPLGEPSSGCIFQNVPATPELKKLFPQFKDATHIGGGFLIDQAGLKGERIGGISVSHKHAAFFINNGQGTAQEAQELIKKVKQQVKNKFKVELEEEVFYLN